MAFFVFTEAIQKRQSVDIHQDAVKRSIFSELYFAFYQLIRCRYQDASDTIFAIGYHLIVNRPVVNVERADLCSFEQSRSFYFFRGQRRKLKTAHCDFRAAYTANGQSGLNPG